MRRLFALPLLLLVLAGCTTASPAPTPVPTATPPGAPTLPPRVVATAAPKSAPNTTPAPPVTPAGSPTASGTVAAFGNEAIRLTSPSPNATVGRSFTVEGEARVFEANVQIRVLDGSNRVVLNTFTTASRGAPETGTFSARMNLPADVPAGPIQLLLFEINAADGSMRNTVTMPLRLQP